jgi:hypothetical protein
MKAFLLNTLAEDKKFWAVMILPTLLDVGPSRRFALAFCLPKMYSLVLPLHQLASGVGIVDALPRRNVFHP